jgi:hypothetical protein
MNTPGTSGPPPAATAPPTSNCPGAADISSLAKALADINKSLGDINQTLQDIKNKPKDKKNGEMGMERKGGAAQPVMAVKGASPRLQQDPSTRTSPDLSYQQKFNAIEQQWEKSVEERFAAIERGWETEKKKAAAESRQPASVVAVKP